MKNERMFAGLLLQLPHLIEKIQIEKIHWRFGHGFLSVVIGKTPLPGNSRKRLAVSWKRHKMP